MLFAQPEKKRIPSSRWVESMNSLQGGRPMTSRRKPKAIIGSVAIIDADYRRPPTRAAPAAIVTDERLWSVGVNAAGREGQGPQLLPAASAIRPALPPCQTGEKIKVVTGFCRRINTEEWSTIGRHNGVEGTGCRAIFARINDQNSISNLRLPEARDCVSGPADCCQSVFRHLEKRL